MFLIFNLISLIKVDKDVVAKWVLSFQAFPSNRASLKEGAFIVAKNHENFVVNCDL